MTNKKTKTDIKAKKEIITKHHDQLIKLIKINVTFSFIIPVSLILGSSIIRMFVVDIPTDIFKSKYGVLIGWIIIMVLYSLMARSLAYIMHSTAEINDYLEIQVFPGENSKTPTKLIKSRNEYINFISSKIRGQISIFNPFSNDFLGYILTHFPMFSITTVTFYIFSYEKGMEAGKSILNSNFLEGTFWELMTQVFYVSFLANIFSDIFYLFILIIMAIPYLIFVSCLWDTIHAFDVNQNELEGFREIIHCCSLGLAVGIGPISGMIIGNVLAAFEIFQRFQDLLNK